MKSSASQAHSPRLDRWFWLAVLVAAAVVVPRSLLISHAHSECYDDQYHLLRGLAFLTGSERELLYNDPPLGEALLALPMLLTGPVPPSVHRTYDEAPFEPPVLYEHRLGPERLLMLIAGWKALLFVPFAAVVFHWCRRLYGLHGAWLALALVLIEPTITAHTPVAALDVLGMQGIVIACFLAWRWLENPTRGRLLAAAAAMAVAMMLKHTAIILPAVVLILALLHWMRSEGVSVSWPVWRGRMNQVALLALVTALSIWALTMFDISQPRKYGRIFGTVYEERWGLISDVINPAMERRQPAGIYLGSLAEAIQHAREGHPSYLLGTHRQHGVWYYFPVVATYKVPLGIAGVLLLAVVSLAWRRPRWDELAMAVPMVAWAAMMMASHLNIGWRHFLPAYVFMLLLAGRCVAPTDSGEVRAIHARPLNVGMLAWLGIIAAAIHVASYHPNYLSYINLPRHKPHLAISDSNIDWGQALKQVRAWLDVNRQRGRNVHLGYFGNPLGPSVPHYLGDRVIELDPAAAPPAEGLLIISPVWEAGAYVGGKYMFLQPHRPLAVIGNCMLVYDLDEIGEQRDAATAEAD